MGFEKGNKLGGRKIGSVNKVNQPIRDNFLKLLETNFNKMQCDLDNLESKDRLKILIDLASFCLPKLKAIEVNNIDNSLGRVAFKEVQIKFTSNEDKNT